MTDQPHDDAPGDAAGEVPRGPARPPRRGGSDRPGEPVGPGGPVGSAAEPALPVEDDGYADRDDVDLDDHHDYVDLPPEASAHKWLAAIVVMALLVGVVVGGTWWWYRKQVDPSGGPGQVVRVEVPAGSTTNGIGQILEGKGVITNAMVFNFYAGRKGVGGFQAGVYEFRENSDFDLVLTTLAAGPKAPVTPKVVKVSVPEGLTVAEIITRINRSIPRLALADLQSALADGKVNSPLRPPEQPSYEGLLFPATYEVADEDAALDVLDQMAAEMDNRLSRLDVAAAQGRISETWGLELSAYELIIVASMVQAEAGNAEEAAKVATVIYNRLAEGMALGIDAVDQYGAELAGVPVDYDDTSSPYNTRRNAGLPPTPIAAPGDYALEAALAPADGSWLYYVLAEPKVHVFVTTNAEFLEAKRICRGRGLGCG